MVFLNIPNDVFSSLYELWECLDDFSFNVILDEMDISEQVRDPLQAPLEAVDLGKPEF